ncbi:hypothetical protein C8J57DRAFT_1230770 [Mycena rebaudengoi]|nr:hypothetical protein C8J57DRAFT_1230770 [Mycena rebaudengoi]
MTSIPGFKLSGKIVHWKENPIFGEYLIKILEISEHSPALDLTRDIIVLGTQHFKSTDPQEQARWSRALGLYFQGAEQNFVEALKCCQRAYFLAKSIGYPTLVGYQALRNICHILLVTGKPLGALTHAKEVYQYAEHMGDLYGQAWDMLAACGQPQSALDLLIRNHQAEIHLLKSDYLESRRLQVAIVSNCQPTSYASILANLNIAIIDIATGADSKIVHQNLDNCGFNLRALYGYSVKFISLVADLVAAELCLRDGAPGAANPMFEQCFSLSLEMNTELALQCAEKLGDLSTHMNSIQATLRWAGIFLGLALRCKEKLQTMQAFRCLGQIFSAEDCMVGIANILNNRGEVISAVELWRAARPLFKKSSQRKDIIKIDAKLAEINSGVLAEYEAQLHLFSELHVPGSAPEEPNISEDEEKAKLAEGSNFGNKGRSSKNCLYFFYVYAAKRLHGILYTSDEQFEVDIVARRKSDLYSRPSHLKCKTR